MRRVRLRPAAAAALVAVAVPAAIAAASPATPARGTSPTPVPPVAVPVAAKDPAGILRGAQIHGVILGNTFDPPESLIADFPRLRALGVNLVSIYIYTYMDHRQATTVSRSGPHSTNDQTLKALTDAAHRAGLGVQYTPIIVVRNSKLWRGRINPANISSWFYSYEQMIQHYLAIAKQMNVEVFALGSELRSMEVWASRWQALAGRANIGYSGLTTYVSQPSSMFKLPWWRSVDLISGAMYYSLSGRPLPSVGSMVYIWRHSYLPQLKALAIKFRRPLLMAEVGYASVVGATIHPALADREGRPSSENEQANAYAALLNATTGMQSWMRGIVWWNYTYAKGTFALDTSFAFRDKKAECVVAQFWSPHELPRLAALGMVSNACVAANL